MGRIRHDRVQYAEIVSLNRSTIGTVNLQLVGEPISYVQQNHDRHTIVISRLSLDRYPHADAGPTNVLERQLEPDGAGIAAALSLYPSRRQLGPNLVAASERRAQQLLDQNSLMSVEISGRI